MTVSRLTLVNDALLLCGENVFNNADDGSREWNVVSAAYDKGLRRLLHEHNWKFGKTVTTVEDRTDPIDPNWEDAYDRPDGAIHITKIMDSDGGEIADWRIIGGKILVNEDGGLLVEHIEDKDPTEWPGLFVDAMMHFVMAAIYRGLKSAPQEARAEEKKAEELMARARPRTDAEEPAQARFVSSLAAARRSRRG